MVGATAAVVFLALVALTTWLVGGSKGASSSPARTAAEHFAEAWSHGDLGQVSFLDEKPSTVAARVRRVVAGLGRGVRLRVTVVSTQTSGDRARARLAVAWSLGPDTAWRYRTRLPLVRRGDRWLVRWTPAVVHPYLRPGDRLSATHSQPPRAAIVDRRGNALVANRKVVHVSVDPSKVTDLGDLSRRLAALVDVEADDIAKRVSSAPASASVDVITLRANDYAKVSAALDELPGVVTQEAVLPLAPTESFARAVIGQVGSATPEAIERSGGRLSAGDLTGYSGLQARYDERLAGRDGVTVYLLHGGPQGTFRTLHHAAPTPGRPIQVSLDRTVQRAADATLVGADHPTALVAIKASDGRILAVSDNGPDPSDLSNPLALSGLYPPGSSFKVVSTYALLRDGLDPQQPVPCPSTVSAGGQTFHNAESEELGVVPFAVDFAHSCNTAFVRLSSRLAGRALPEAAAAFGLGRHRHLGLPAATASVPEPHNAADLAAETFGQGRLGVTPLDMAVVAATAAARAYHPPRLVLDPSPGGSDQREPLDPHAAATLQRLMRLVVTEGTGEALGDVPGAPVAGKTGTAEYGTAQPPATHAWFIGFQGDLAFAVFVEDGGFGAKAAAPLAARFLAQLH